MPDGVHFAEVQYYFILEINKVPKTLALVALYDSPDPVKLQNSFYTNIYCKYIGDAGLHVIDIKDIQSVVAMVLRQGSFFVVEKMGLDIAHLGGVEEDVGIE